MALFGKKKIESDKDYSEAKQTARPAAVDSSVLRKIWITEKTVAIGNLRKYAFLVRRDANAADVKRAVENVYKVTVEKVNVINTAKSKRFRGRAAKPERFKKAIVTLAKGQELDIIPK